MNKEIEYNADFYIFIVSSVTDGIFFLPANCFSAQIASSIINSLSASLLLNIFLSFEVGIAHAIANFK